MSSHDVMYIFRNIVVDDLLFAFDLAVKVRKNKQTKRSAIRKALNLTQISNNLSNEIYKEVKI